MAQCFSQLHVPQHFLKHGHKAPALPAFLQLQQIIDTLSPPFLVLEEVIDFLVGPAQHGAGQGTPHQLAVTGIDHGLQQCIQVFRLAGFEHATTLHRYRVNAMSGQHLSQRLRLEGGAYQYCNVAWCDGIFSQQAGVFLPLPDQGSDFVRNGFVAQAAGIDLG